MATEPKTLQQAIQYFSDPENCLQFLLRRRYPEGVFCPRCASKEVRYLATRRIWECKAKHPKRQFSVKVRTIFEDSPIGLDKWLVGIWMIANCKNGISSYEIHRALGITQKTAWFMLHRIRLALRVGVFHKLGGGPDGSNEVEVDETFIGGRAENMHKDRRLKLNQLRNEVNRPDHYMGKTVVMGMLDRQLREVRATVIPNIRRDVLQAQILKEVKLGSKVYTDQNTSYMTLSYRYAHEVVNHIQHYVVGRVHTNGIENFWSLLKRSLKGTYVAVEPFHLERYVDEQAFRYNNRATKENPMTDSDRFDKAVRNIVGKRITYKELTGKEGETPF